MKTVTMRPLELSDVPALECWEEQPHVYESGIDGDDWKWSEEIPKDHSWQWMFMAELDGKPLGCVQVIDPEKEITHYWGDCESNLRAIDIWIGDEQNLGKGYGTMMMNQSINFCFSDASVTAILIDPLAHNKKAIRFYEKLGFEFVEDRNFEGDACKVYQLRREKWQESTNISGQ